MIGGGPNLAVVPQDDLVNLLRRVLAFADHATAPDLELGGQAVHRVAGWISAIGTRSLFL